MTKATFEVDKFEELAKKSKQKKTKKSILTVVLSVVLSVVLVFAILVGIFFLNDRRGYENAKFIEMRLRFMEPNLETNIPDSKIGLYNGKSTMEVRKNVDGYTVNWGSVEGSFDVFKKLGNMNTWTLGGASYPEGRKLCLFNPNSTYKFRTSEMTDQAIKDGTAKKVKGKNGSSWYTFPEDIYQDAVLPNDLANVVKTENRVVEVGISFDKPYTYEEVQNMIPDNLNQAWYWVSEGEQATKKVERTILTEPNEDIWVPTITFGFPKDSDIKFGELMLGEYWKDDNGLNQVFEKLQKDYASKMDKKERAILDGILKNNHLKNKKEMLLNGIVLTGKSENFQQLEGESWIRAASAGASAEIVPYIKPTK